MDRVVNRQMLKSIVTPGDLKQMLCGQQKLDFSQLREACRYGNGFTPTTKTIVWFWEIVLEEFDDDQRRRLLVFSTGTDRAPINGLRTLKFAIVKDNENEHGDQKMPTSHTCFN